MKINITGDIALQHVEKVTINEKLKGILRDGHINVTNIEVPLYKSEHPSPKSGPSLSQSEDVLEWLVANGFNLFPLANNHIFDYGGHF